MLSFCTMTLANSKSSSFSRISANVRYMRSVLRLRHSCRMIRLPLDSRRPLSVLKSSNRLFMNDLKYPSSELDEIWASSCKSCLMTY